MGESLWTVSRYNPSYDNIKGHKPHPVFLKPHPLPLMDSVNYWMHGTVYRELRDLHHGYWTNSSNSALKLRSTCLSKHNSVYVTHTVTCSTSKRFALKINVISLVTYCITYHNYLAIVRGTLKIIQHTLSVAIGFPLTHFNLKFQTTSPISYRLLFFSACPADITPVSAILSLFPLQLLLCI